MNPRVKELLAASREAARGARWPMTAFAIAALCFLALHAVGPIVHSLPPFPSPVASDERTARVAVEPTATGASPRAPVAVTPQPGGLLTDDSVGGANPSGAANAFDAAGLSASGAGLSRPRPRRAQPEPGSPPPPAPPPVPSPTTPPSPPITTAGEPVGAEPELVPTRSADDRGKKVKKAKRHEPGQGDGDKGRKSPPAASTTGPGAGGRDNGEGRGKKGKDDRGDRGNAQPRAGGENDEAGTGHGNGQANAQPNHGTGGRGGKGG